MWNMSFDHESRPTASRVAPATSTWLGRLVAAVASVALAGCSSPADDWAGVYSVFISETSYGCGTGDRGGTSEVERTWILEAVASDEFVIRGQCDFHFRVASERTADLIPMQCDATLPDGRPAQFDISDGRLYRDDDGGLYGNLTLTATVGSECVRNVAQVSGYMR